MNRPRLTRILIALVASGAAVLLALVGIEVWVRLAWDASRGEPGFFLNDPVRGQRLAANYDGWFAGVPAHTNSLGFRDVREYSLAKAPGTFRILVLGDSVTFGHGATFETSYPYLMEQRLKAWRPGVTWEVWNLGVPGYNTAQELAYLEQVGERYAPDLVIVGFFSNDFTGLEPIMNPGPIDRAVSAAMRTMQRYAYSTELYKRIFLTVKFRLTESTANQQRLAHLEEEDELLVRPNANRGDEQQLSAAERFGDDDVRSFVCEGIGPQGPPVVAADLKARAPYMRSWFDAVDGFQALDRAGKFRIVFFINMAPNECPAADRFFDHGTSADDQALLEILGRGTPAISSWSEFLHYRPSQMPRAAGHSLGNANLVKANVLFEFLRDRVLPPLVPATP